MTGRTRTSRCSALTQKKKSKVSQRNSALKSGFHNCMVAGLFGWSLDYLVYFELTNKSQIFLVNS